MEESLLQSAREVIGGYLKGVRLEKKITKYRITKDTGLRLEAIDAIESGSTSYTIDSFLKYTTGIGAYIFFGDKSGKDETKSIDTGHMMNSIGKNDPKL